MESKLRVIARKYLRIPNLRMRGNDMMDTHEVMVWEVSDALKAAYKAGKTEAEEKEHILRHIQRAR